MADGTMPEKMNHDTGFDPMVVATIIRERYERTQLDPAQTAQEMLSLIDNLKRMPGDDKYRKRVASLEVAILALVETLTGK